MASVDASVFRLLDESLLSPLKKHKTVDKELNIFFVFLFLAKNKMVT